MIRIRRTLMVKRLLRYAKPYTIRIIALFITGGMVSIFTLLEPATMGLLTDALFSRTNGISLNAFMFNASKTKATEIGLFNWDVDREQVTARQLEKALESAGAKVRKVERRAGFAKVVFQLPQKVGADVVLKSVKQKLADQKIQIEVAPVIVTPLRKKNVFFPQIPTVFIIPFLLVFFQIFRGLFTYCQNYLASSIGQKVVMRLRNEIFEHLQNLSFGFYEQKRTGQLMSRVLNDVGIVQGLFSSTITDLIMQPLMVVLAVGWALFFNWKLTLIFLLIKTFNKTPPT
jgi:ABC-type multidrug transport system fused ATPase/permease subunit